MKLSVIITTHNRPEELLRAVRSVLSQSKQPLEIVIVDDASVAGSSEGYIRSQVQSAATTIRYFYNSTNLGSNASRNLGVSHAQGDWVLFLDDDDYFLSEKIANLGDPVDGTIVVYSNRIIRGNRDRRTVAWRRGVDLKAMLGRNLIGSTTGVAVKRAALIDAGGFDEGLPAFQDYDLWLRLVQRGHVQEIATWDVIYDDADSKTRISRSGQKQVLAMERILSKYRGLPPEDFATLSNHLRYLVGKSQQGFLKRASYLAPLVLFSGTFGGRLRALARLFGVS